jgi:hypothetical protein
VVASYESKILTRLGDSLRDEEGLFYFVTISIEVPKSSNGKQQHIL